MSSIYVPEYGKDDWVVFLSHAGTDAWVANRIAQEMRSCGAVPFLDEADIDIGEDFEEYIRLALKHARELIVLLTPWALKRPYVWAEIGAAWGRGIPIVGILYGITATELQSDPTIPVILKRRNLININELDEYFEQLGQRIAVSKTKDEENDANE